MIFRTKHLVNTFLYLIQGPKFWGGDPPSQSSTVTQATIPEELKPYISTYMGAAEKQLYQKNDKGEVTGFQPYKAYGATFDEAGNQTGYDPAKGIAAWDPMQEQAYKSTQGLSTGDTFNTASNMAGASGAGSLSAGQNFQNQMTDPNSVNAYMSPYLQNVMNQQIGAANRQYDITGAEQQGRATQVGAFGGSREALMAAENERARNTAIGGIQATGYQNAFTNAQQQQKNVADIGLQGLSQAGQAAGTMGNIGGQNLAAQTNILKTQADAGALARSREQAIKDTALLDYSNAMNKPMQDIGTMSNLVRGTPTNSSSATTYAPAPSALSQIGGLAATGIGAYGALKANANGGIIEDRGYASGGIVGYSSGGNVEGSMRNKLEDLDTSHLQEIIKENESPEMTKLAKEVLAKNYAKGGIVAFANGGTPYSVQQLNEKKKLEEQAAANSSEAQDIRRLEGKKDKQKAITPIQEIAPTQEAVAPAVQKGIAPTIDESMVSQQQDVAKLREEAAKPEEQLMAEDKKRRDDVLGADTATIEYRKKIMEERANAPDEAKRQMYMRLMEFGANWASTPGAPLVAGMKALKEGLPSVMADTKANKKAMKDIDASIYALDHADRLEKAGYLDRAAAKREKASESLMKASPQLVEAAIKKETLDEQARHGKRIADLQGQQNAQQAAYQTATLNKPTAASMAANYIEDRVKGGASRAEAYADLKKLEATQRADPALGYEVGIAKNKYDNAVEAQGLLGMDTTSPAYKKAEQTTNKALTELNNLQRRLQGLPPNETVETPKAQLTPEEQAKRLSGLSKFQSK